MGKKQSKSKNISDDETVKRKSQSSRPIFFPPEAVAATHVILPPLVKPIGMLDPCVNIRIMST